MFDVVDNTLVIKLYFLSHTHMKQIKLYTTPSCTSCKAMKPELEDFCIINDIELMIIDAEVEDIPEYVTKVPTVDYILD